MNKKEANVVQGLIKEIEFRLARIKAITESSVEENSYKILEMDAREFFESTQVPFSTNRVLKWLDSEKIKTVREVTRYSHKNLRRYRNLGDTSIHYIEACLAKHDLRLKED